MYASAQNVTIGDGYMVAGDLWTTIKPLNSAEKNGVEDPKKPWLHFLTFGPDGTDWANPGSHWPGGYDLVQTWRDGKRMVFPTREATGEFRFAYYAPTVNGAGDPARNYKRDATFVDASRTHLVYEAGFPTNIGVDFRIRAHQYTINEQNLNDFVAVEITMINTGEVDINADGAVEETDHRIDAIAASIWVEPTISVRITETGGRSNRFGAGRTVGYAGAPDPVSGSPFDIFYWFPNTPENLYADREVPPVGTRLIGVNDVAVMEGYTDVWSGHRYLGVKQGSIDDGDFTAITASSTDKLTLFGSPPVGSGTRRGWYGSISWEPQLFDFNDPMKAFRAATATWYADYGKHSTDDHTIDLSPNPTYFSGGSTDDVTSFVVGDPSSRPDGDIKYGDPNDAELGKDAPVWEDVLVTAAGDFYSAIGSTVNHDFLQKISVGNGPYSLEVGESMTIVFTEFAGFRFEGLADAARAADWAWERGWDLTADIPVPAAPDNLVEPGDDGSTRVRWVDVSQESINAGTRVDGYKIYRSAKDDREQWLDKGFRYLDNYHHQNVVGADVEEYLDAVNPYFDAEAEFVDPQGTYEGAEWGPYTLVAIIPNAELGLYDDFFLGYEYSYLDTTTNEGSTYWYYVAAYRDETFTGPQGTVNRIESSNFTRNGRNSRFAAPGELSLSAPWGWTYPFAVRNSSYPVKGTNAYKNMGAPYTVPKSTSLDEPDGLPDFKLSVYPNPTTTDYVVEVVTNNAGNIDIDVFDMLGRRVRSERRWISPKGVNKFPQPVAGLAAGVYLVWVRQGAETRTETVLIGSR